MIAQDFFQRFRENLKTVLVVHGLPSARTHLFGVHWVRQKRLNGGGPLHRIAVRHQIAGNAILNQLWRASRNTSPNPSPRLGRAKISQAA